MRNLFYYKILSTALFALHYFHFVFYQYLDDLDPDFIAKYFSSFNLLFLCYRCDFDIIISVFFVKYLSTFYIAWKILTEKHISYSIWIRKIIIKQSNLKYNHQCSPLYTISLIFYLYIYSERWLHCYCMCPLVF